MVDRGTLDINKDLSFVDPRIRSQAPVDRMVLLPDGFAPTNWDVICQRGKDSYEHVGNRRFRVCIENNLEKYSEAKTKLDKSMIVMSIVDNIREATKLRGGGFVKQDLTNGRWYEVGDKLAREKVGQALREAIKQKNQHPPRPGTPLEPSRRESSSSIDNSSSPKSLERKLPANQGRRMHLRDQRQLLLRALDEKNGYEGTSPPDGGHLLERSEAPNSQRPVSMIQRYRSADSLRYGQLLAEGDKGLDTKLPAQIKQKDSDESSGSLSDLIGTTSALYGYQDAMSVSSSIFSTEYQLELHEHPAGTDLGAAEFDLSGLRQEKQMQEVSAAAAAPKSKSRILERSSKFKSEG